MALAAQPVLSIRDLTVDFGSDAGIVHAVRGVSADLWPGRTLAVVGESGSGKSVTSLASMGLLSKRVRNVGGSIVFRDPKTGTEVDLAKLDPDGKQIRRIRGARISMIFQEPMTSLSPVHSVGNQITEALRIHSELGRQEAKDVGIALLQRVGFVHPDRVFDNYPFELSGGMRQRAMIAMALMCRPALLIADEPTTALDVTTQAHILGLLKSLQADTQMAMMFITHDLGVVANIADDVLVMYRGEVMERGTREEIFRNPRHPYLKMLLRAVPRFHMPQGERLQALREIPVSVTDLGYTVKRLNTASRTVLAAEDVCKTFTLRKGMWSGNTETVRALLGVSLSLQEGRTLGLVGESGSGKTTLARAILRAVNAAPTSGTIWYDDGSGPKDVWKLEKEQLLSYRKNVQFVFQDPFSSLNPRMTVGDIISEPLEIYGICGRTEQYERVKTLLRLVGLDPRAMRRYPHSFSGGERQRIGIARALALSPQVILCDEPTSALDVSVQAQVLNLLRDLQNNLGIALLFVSHNLAVIDYMAHDIAVMCRGLIVEKAPRDVLFRAPQHPYTQALLRAVPEADIDHPLHFEKLTRGYSDPALWPEPFAVVPDAQPPIHVEVGPKHWIQVNGNWSGEMPRVA